MRQELVDLSDEVWKRTRTRLEGLPLHRAAGAGERTTVKALLDHEAIRRSPISCSTPRRSNALRDLGATRRQMR